MIRRPATAFALVAGLLLWGPIASSRGQGQQQGWQAVTYGTVVFEVPSSWPVLDLAAEPSRCVRFDVSALYLGHGGERPDCPATVVGRTNAVQVEPLDGRSAVQAPLAPATTTMNGQTVRFGTGTEAAGWIVAAFPDLGVRFTLAFASDRTLAERILGTIHRVSGGRPPRQARASKATHPTSAAHGPVSAGVYTGEGFDACTAPSESTMTAWLASPYRSLGIYIGGIERACSQANLTATWVSDVQSMGWSLVPIYVGLQAPCVDQPGLLHIDPTKADQQGIDAADDAVDQAGLVGIGPGNPVYFDMEAYDSTDLDCVDTVRTFISAWAGELHVKGYLAAMYGGAASGISDEADIYGDPDYNQLDDIWYAHWDGKHTVFGDPYFPDDVWPNHQRLHQYAGGHNETWGGVTINIDNDYDDGAVVRIVNGIAGDFNGDGFADLAVGVPYEDLGTHTDAGAVSVIYGTSTGLSAASNQFWTEDSSGIPDAAQTGDRFGSAVAAGDFNGDGFTDLAVGAPRDDVGTIVDGGEVIVIYGTGAGLASTGAQIWSQQSTGILDQSEKSDRFGYSLSAGDFDGDGYGDLAVGVPFESVNSVSNAGGVNVIYGSSGGLSSDGNQFWTQDSSGIPDSSETGDLFAYALAAGDFNGNGDVDLAIGAPDESVGTVVDAGQVTMLEGSNSGLRSTGASIWSQNTSGILGTSDSNDQFGDSLAAGDFNGDGPQDLAVGVPTETLSSATSAGGVNVIYGSSAWLSSTGNQFITQDSADVPDSSETGDNWGRALAAGDFGGDGFVDLAVGAPSEDLDTILDAGQLTILPGSADGLLGAGSAIWNQDSAGILDSSEAGDQFGAWLSTSEMGNGTQADLAVGISFEDVGTVADAGAAQVLYGSATGMGSASNQFWNQDSTDILDSAESGDRLGSASA